MKEIKNHKLGVLELIFKISYFCLALGTFNPFIYGSPVQPILVKITLLLGFVTILFRVVQYKSYIKMPAIVIMILFCTSFLITAVLNREYGIVENGKWIIWTGLQFFVLYVCNTTRSKDSYKKEFKILSHVMLIYSLVAAGSSLWMLITRYSVTWLTRDQELLIAGLKWGRLWGVYTDPNYGAVFSVVAMILSIYFISRKKQWLNIFYGINIFINLLYLIFSDSRTGEVAFVCGLGFFLYTLIWNKKEKYTKVKKHIICITSMMCFILLSVIGIKMVKTEYNKRLAPAFVKMFPQRETNMKSKKKPSNALVGRKKDIENDVSNGRLELWKSGGEIWKSAPFFGAGYATFVSYAKKHVPKTYAVNNDQGTYVSLHNSFVNTLAFQGGVGLLLFLLIIGRIVTYLWSIIWKEQEDFIYLSVLLSCVGVVFVSMVFLLEGLYTNSLGSFVLWTFLGYLVQYTYQKKEGKK